MGIKTELVDFRTEDGLLLPGLLYQPSGSREVLITLHGNGSSSVFYKADYSNNFARVLAKKNISYFPFNNRGAHYIKKINVDKEGEEERVKYGMTYELIKDCILDIDGAINFLKAKGFKKFYLIGFSTGANKICVYNYYKPKNPVSKYILAGGGDDTGIIYNEIGDKKKFFHYLEIAKAQMGKGLGEKLIPKYVLDWLISYQSFYDEANPDGDYNTFPFYEVINNLKLSKKELFREYKSIKKPTLVVYGDQDEYCWGDVEGVITILKTHIPSGKNFFYKLIKGADHGFKGKEKELFTLVADWLVS